MFDKIEKNENKKIPPTVFFANSFKDLEKIITVLELKRDVIVNVNNMDQISRFRIIDFLSGYIFAKNGYREKYEDAIFLFHY